MGKALFLVLFMAFVIWEPLSIVLWFMAADELSKLFAAMKGMRKSTTAKEEMNG